ncbi:hypothetical protein [Delftia acidovorans]|uniref:hypothetical protein n=1 Tax=Delftia acidovorans TaxID=80866 RepID=UPI00333F0834
MTRKRSALPALFLMTNPPLAGGVMVMSAPPGAAIAAPLKTITAANETERSVNFMVFMICMWSD